MYIFTFFPSLYFTAPSMTGVRSPIFYYFELLDLEEHRQSSLFFSHGLMSSVTSWAKKEYKSAEKVSKNCGKHFLVQPISRARGDAAAAQN